MRCHTGTPTRASKRAVASSVATKLLYQRLSWSIDVLQELRCLPGPPRRALDHQPEPRHGAGAPPAATLIFPALGLMPARRRTVHGLPANLRSGPSGSVGTGVRYL